MNAERRVSVPSALLALLCILFIAAAYAHGEEAQKKSRQPKSAPEKETTATIRIGKYADHSRIVFETTGSYVDKASVMVIGENNVKVDFQSPVTFMVPQKGALKDPLKIEKGRPPVEVVEGLRITATENSCTMQIDHLDDINVSKLASPPRLVVDAFINKTAPSQSADSDKEDAGDIQFASIMIDAGHGGYDTGIRYGSKIEKDITLLFAKDFANALGKSGKKVFLTRKGDQAISLKERVKTANFKSAALLLSIHTSSAGDFSVYSPQRVKGRTDRRPAKAVGAEGQDEGQAAKGKQPAPDADAISDALANSVAQSVRSEFKMEVMQKRLPARLITCAHSPALLIELPGPGKFTYDAKTRDRLINAILRGIASVRVNQGAGVHGQGPVEG